jgi:hypothetical protein
MEEWLTLAMPLEVVLFDSLLIENYDCKREAERLVKSLQDTATRTVVTKTDVLGLGKEVEELAKTETPDITGATGPARAPRRGGVAAARGRARTFRGVDARGLGLLRQRLSTTPRILQTCSLTGNIRE